MEYDIEMEEDPNTKHIHVVTSEKREEDSATSSQSIPFKKERRKKMVTLTDDWSRITDAYSTKESQVKLLQELHLLKDAL